MKALTVCQPYAELLIAGLKPVENRKWRTAFRGRLWIHAGKSKDWLDDEELHPSELAVMRPLVFGAIIGAVDIVDCCSVDKLSLELQQSHHANGPFCLVAQNPRRLEQPVPCRGALALWDVPADVVIQLAQQVAAQAERR